MREKESSAAKCPLRHLGEVFGGKWKLPILCILTEHGPKRYSAIQRGLAGVTNVMLTQSLRELEEHGLVHRTQYNEVPPRVEYSLTEKGRSTLPFLTAAAQWAIEDLKSADREKLCDECVAKE